jgi:hypothetical protein
MGYALLTVCVLGIANAAHANDGFLIVLHARTPSGTGSCAEVDLPDCGSILPITQVAANTEFRLYIFIDRYTGINAVLTAFQWPADWVCDPDSEPPITFGCRGATQAYAHEPQNPGGPLDGTLATVFDCFSGPGLAAISRIDFLSGAGGCLTQVNPVQGTGRIELLDCLNKSTTLDATEPGADCRLGSICVGTPGRDPCNCFPVVEEATWGSVKATYR